MMNCKWKVWLKLGVICMCILWISWSSSIMTIFRQFYQSYAPFCTSNLLNFWFPNDKLWVQVRCVVCLFDTSDQIISFLDIKNQLFFFKYILKYFVKSTGLLCIVASFMSVNFFLWNLVITWGSMVKWTCNKIYHIVRRLYCNSCCSSICCKY
jgi:hypothetical protein